RKIEPRYSDVPTIQLTVPTLSGFVAMKASAWRDRHTARDLFDLAALAELGAINADAVALLRTVTSVPLVDADLVSVPPDLHWRDQLAHQCRLDSDPETALRKVYEAWTAAAHW
ncbi:MAG: hypothetical protein QOI55_2632, partial [Actinomycetota bacterium]|nr:hypothetical protein [Actinomycetota bacterium]